MDDDDDAIMMCGLPGSGKTNLSNAYKVKMKESNGGGDNPPYCVVVVCYDALLPIDVEKQLIAADDGHRPHTGCILNWKKYRRCIVKAVESLVVGILQESDCHHNSPPPTTNASSLVHQLKARILLHNGLVPENKLDKRFSSSRFVFIIDDNMYFKSMRYEYFQLARKYTIGFCQIFVSCDFEVLRRRNNTREIKVDEYIISTMKAKFEMPDPSHHFWEERTINIDTEKDHLQSLWPQLNNFILEAMNHPVLSWTPCLDQTALSRTICTRNVLHQIDNSLRRVVSEAVKSHPTNSKMDKKSFAAVCNDARQKLLARFRTGDIVVDNEISAKIENGDQVDSKELLDKYTRALFNAELVL